MARKRVIAKRPWHDWYHVMGHTYGTWLPGDHKGFRTRHHREHIEGDYKNPPPKDKYKERHERAKKLMKREPVFLDDEQRMRACDELVKSLQKRNIDVVVISVDAVHIHILARFPDHDPRKWVGIAKRESSHYLRETGQAPEGGLWAVRTKCLPVTDRAHQLRAAKYIFDHKKEGAAVWLVRSKR